jgi:hypothetical protein
MAECPNPLRVFNNIAGATFIFVARASLDYRFEIGWKSGCGNELIDHTLD